MPRVYYPLQEHNVKTITLTRTTNTVAGILGKLSVLNLHTIELNWRDNKRKVSCIPAGTYVCEFKASPKFGMCYHVLDVPERSAILIHAANFAGLVSLGQRADLEGCIAFGTSAGELYGQPAVLNSKSAIREFVRFLKKEKFTLEVIDNYD